MSRYWLTPAYEAGFDDQVTDINDVYKQAQERAKQGHRTESLDEMTGVQALERKHPGLPMCAGKVERREFEYIRHGTLSFIQGSYKRFTSSYFRCSPTEYSLLEEKHYPTRLF